MKAKLSNNDFCINWINSPALDQLVLDIEGTLDVDWDVTLDGGSAWARLLFEIKSKTIVLTGSYQDESLFDEELMEYKEKGEGHFTINVELPEIINLEVGKIEAQGSFYLTNLELDLSINENQVSLLREGKEISIQAREARAEFNDA